VKEVRTKRRKGWWFGKGWLWRVSPL